MIVDHITNWQTYSLGAAWAKAFAFLETVTPETEEKRYEIDGDSIYAIVMSYATRPETSPDAVLESHRKYVDIQMAIVDSERIAVYPRHELKVKTAYLPERDVEFYVYEKPAKLQLSMTPGVFACLLPQDAHMPQLNPGSEAATVKKVVVKIALDSLEL